MACRKKDRTLDDYKKAGAEARIIKTLLAKFWVDCGNLLPAKDGDKLAAVSKRFDEIVCYADDCLFKDFPDAGDDYVDVFYGAIDKIMPINEVDKEVREIARKIMKEMIGDENGS